MSQRPPTALQYCIIRATEGRTLRAGELVNAVTEDYGSVALESVLRCAGTLARRGLLTKEGGGSAKAKGVFYRANPSGVEWIWRTA